MPVYEIGLDDGRKLRIEADNQDAALAGVEHFKANEAPAAPKEAPSALKDVAMQLPTGFNEALANTAGAPVDAVNWGLKKLGVPTSDTPFAGSQSIKNALGYIGANPDNAPAQTTAGKFARAAGGGAAGVMLPEAALAGASGAIAPKILPYAKAVLGDGTAPVRSAVAGAAGGIGSEAAGEATEGTAAEPIARTIGGMIGGGAAGAAAAKLSAQKMLPKTTLDDVDAAVSAGYNKPEIKNLKLQQQPVNQLGDTIAQALNKDAFYAEDHAPVFNQLRRLSEMQGPVEFDRIDAARKQLGQIANQLGPDFKSTPTAAAAMKAKEHIDNFIDAVGATNPAPIATGNGFILPNPVIAAGNPAAARAALLEARANSKAAIRAGGVDKRIGNAEATAASQNSGWNVANKVRQAFVPYLKNDEAKMGGWSPETQVAMNKLVRGTNAMNALRWAGNAIGGQGITAFPGAYLGHAAFGPVGAAMPLAGYALKKLANVATVKQANKVKQMLIDEAPAAKPTIRANEAISQANSAAMRQTVTQDALRAAAAQLLRKRNAP